MLQIAASGGAIPHFLPLMLLAAGRGASLGFRQHGCRKPHDCRGQHEIIEPGVKNSTHSKIRGQKIVSMFRPLQIIHHYTYVSSPDASVFAAAAHACGFAPRFWTMVRGKSTRAAKQTIAWPQKSRLTVSR